MFAVYYCMNCTIYTSSGNDDTFPTILRTNLSNKAPKSPTAFQIVI